MILLENSKESFEFLQKLGFLQNMLSIASKFLKYGVILIN